MDENTLDSIKHLFQAMKTAGDGALEQTALEDLLWEPGPEMNSIATIIRHMHGNMLSRWTDFLNSDGEKPSRNRDAEFEPLASPSRDAILELWERGWRCVFAAIDPLTPADLNRTVTIRGQAHTVTEAAHRQIYHYGYHIGQIVQLARMRRGAAWKTLSIPRGASRDYRPIGHHGEPGTK